MNRVSLAIRRRAFNRTIDDLLQAPWDRPDEMSARRDRLLRRTLERARKTPFYAPLLAGLDIDGLGDLDRVPVTGKHDILASGRSRTVPGSRIRRRRTMGTSGTSAEPMRFEVDRLFAVRHNATRAFVYRVAAVPEGARVVEILSGTAVVDEPDPTCPPFRRHVVGYANPHWLDEVYRVEPDLVYGNRSHLLALTERPLPPRPPRWIASSSETLQPADRRTLRGHFGVEPIDLYGLSEASYLAYRRRAGEPWTVLEPRVHVEVLDDRRRPVGPGETGEVVVTTLAERTTPLVRYATGDLAKVAVPLRGGGSALVLESLEGRSVDSIIDAGGRTVTYSAVATSGFWARGDVAATVRRWQVHQGPDRSIVVSVELAEGDVDNDARTEAARSAIWGFMTGVLGDLPVDVRVVERLLPVDGEKFRAVTSDAHRS